MVGIADPTNQAHIVKGNQSCHDILDIIAIFETRLTNEGYYTKLAGGYLFYWSGREEMCRRESGVVFDICKAS